MNGGGEAHRGQGCFSTGGDSTMMRKRNLIIAIAAGVAFTLAPLADAFARGGGGGGHGGMGGGGGHGMGMGGGRGMGMGMGMGGRGMAFASHGPIGRVGPIGMTGARSMAWHGNHVAFGHHFRHHRFHNRFFFAGAPFAYASYYDDGCYARVWGPYGWHWTNVCYY
jgi:hypothetical protein